MYIESYIYAKGNKMPLDLSCIASYPWDRRPDITLQSVS